MMNYYLSQYSNKVSAASRYILLFVCTLMVPLMVLGQNKTIKGTITDEKTGEPLTGAAVKVQNSSIGSSTDAKGAFTLQVPSNAVLVISYVGYESRTVAIGNRISLDIKLKESTSTLNEVVVVGYGTMRKKDLTGSVVQVRPDKLANENPKTVQDILRGTPGLQVGYDASAKGGGSMQIRGQRSVYDKGGHNDPLIILDGMIFYGELSEINPDDIGQIDILKDAAAAAVYGSRAASGVIIITTKKGKPGKPVVNASVNYGTTTKSEYREVFGPDAYMKYREDWYKKDTYGKNAATGNYEAYQTSSTIGKPGLYDNPANLANYGVSLEQWRAYTTNVAGETDASIYAKRLGMESSVLTDYLAGNTFDWYAHTFQTGINQDYNTSISGASDNMNYYMSLGYLKNEGAVKYNDYSAVRSNLKVEGKVNKWLEIGANVNFQNRSDGDLQPGLGLNYWDANQIRNSPYSHYRNEDGSLSQYPMGDDKKRGVNYDFDKQYLELEKGYTVLNSILNAKVKLPFNIVYSFNASPRYQWFYDRYFMSAQLPGSDPKQRGVNRENAKRFDWSLNNTLYWEQTFAEKHRVNLTLVQEAEERRFWQDRMEARNIQPSDALGLHNTSNGTKENNSISTNDTHQTGDALLARGFYSYDNRYTLNASIRRDGYSAFGQNNPYAVFPAFGLAWSFTNEKFFKWQDIMSSGKLRISWGKNGNRSLEDPYVSLTNLGAGSGATMGYIVGSGMEEMKYLMVDRMANPNLQWEKTAATNIGLDFGLFHERILGTIEYYSMKTEDMIMYQRLPGFTGFPNIITNLGEVRNKGFEFSISSTNIQNDVFRWNTSLSFSYNQNRIKHLYYQNENVLDAQGNIIGVKEMDDRSSRDGKGWFIGQPISEIWDYRVSGIWQADELEEAKRYGQKPGDPKVVNSYTADDKVNADGSTTPVYNDKDKQFLGQEAPPVNWQLRNDFTLFKNWNLSFNIYSYMGHKSLSGEYLNKDNGGSLITYNFNTFAKEYWTPENPTNEYARLDATVPSGAGANKLYDRSFIRLENIAVGYTFPKKWASRFDVSNVKIFGSVRNVGVWQKDWEYGDPETGGLATRLFSLGLNVTF
ncbi:SusC/RagA family TonB-linked outer membrane protein [Arcticibacter tournemirensis]|uniref:SusC/RagA family TonB-linked outer membrane protein n=1 Tax=Arcticibacter tournemirensis TaxID=699437 RepID=A0A4Q0MGQ0_9SPHI|nr:SusC/RagA family TonB-linked outer membrane protein [Arcticibacter tournemirensis]RXF72433.1 SusC/RagA family TonB-linked outer membrane protein [Arcticibacter tournemirensis]